MINARVPEAGWPGALVQKGVLLILVALAAVGCASNRQPLPTPVLMVGTVERPNPTDWVFNHCEYVQPVLMQVRSDQCLAHGGELHDSTLTNAQPVGNWSLGRTMRIAFPGHGYVSEYRKRHYLILQPSTPDFREATGIPYIATEFDNYDAAGRCLYERGWGHVDNRYCPDLSFHDRYRD